jgi:beta-glucosidase/6-phospho-beta-glucosidase/beta-galactosidase
MRDLRCKQCQLEDNTGLCDRSDCINYSPACNIKVAEARADERAKTINEVLEVVKVMPAMTMTNPAHNHPANAYKLVDKAELRAKLEEMKGKNE